MKHPATKYKRCGLQWRRRLICVPAGMLFCVLSTQAQTDVTLPPIGGDGGIHFNARCSQGKLLTGFQLRAGDDIDAIQPMCVTAYGPAETGRADPPSSSSYGGDGGSLVNLFCPKEAPIVIGLHILSEGTEIVTVNSIGLFCGLASSTQTRTEWLNAVFNAPQTTISQTAGIDGGVIYHGDRKQFCAAGLVAVGINGRAGKLLDAVGLICSEPTLPPQAAQPPKSPPRDVVRALTGRPLPSRTTPNPPRPTCDAAREARARNKPSAPGLEESCHVELAAKGAAVAQVDAVVAQDRAAEADVLFQHGFDIATGIFGDPALGANGNHLHGTGISRYS